MVITMSASYLTKSYALATFFCIITFLGLKHRNCYQRWQQQQCQTEAMSVCV